MAGIVPALKTYHRLGMVGEPVDDFSLAFIAPLGTYYYDIFCHVFL
jgi:hypothetical protein